MLWKSGRKAEVQGGGWCAPSSSLSLHKTPPPRVAHSISGAPSIPPSHLLLFTSSAALSSSALPLAHLLTRDPGKELQRSLESLVTATPGRPRPATAASPQRFYGLEEGGYSTVIGETNRSLPSSQCLI